MVRASPASSGRSLAPTSRDSSPASPTTSSRARCVRALTRAGRSERGGRWRTSSIRSSTSTAEATSSTRSRSPWRGSGCAASGTWSRTRSGDGSSSGSAWTRPTRPSWQRLSRPLAAYAVEAIDDSRFTHQVELRRRHLPPAGPPDRTARGSARDGAPGGGGRPRGPRGRPGAGTGPVGLGARIDPREPLEAPRRWISRRTDLERLPKRAPPAVRVVDRRPRAPSCIGSWWACVGPTEAEDCLQETFMSALRAYPRLSHGDNLRAWLYTIAQRKATDAIRRAARRPTRALDGLDAAAPPGPSPWTTGSGTPCADCRPSSATAVVHRFVLDLAYAEIGARMGTSEEAARQNVSAGPAPAAKGGDAVTDDLERRLGDEAPAGAASRPRSRCGKPSRDGRRTTGSSTSPTAAYDSPLGSAHGRGHPSRPGAALVPRRGDRRPARRACGSRLAAHPRGTRADR